MSEEDWGVLADEQEKKLASTVFYSQTHIYLLAMISEWITREMYRVTVSRFDRSRLRP